jgi:hypothetical protein
MERIFQHSYLDRYAKAFSQKVCDEYFGTKKYMSGQEIIRLTPSTQLNLMVIKSLFDLWQEEMDILARNPYFDYRDYAVKESLKEFMNVLSRAIKIEKNHFMPLLEMAVKQTVTLGWDPLGFFLEETKKVQERSPQYFKDLKKYLKWHTELWLPIIEKSPDMASASDLEEGLRAQYDRLKHDLEPAEALLKPFDQVLPLDHGELLVHEEASSEADVPMASPEDEAGDEDTFSANIQQTYENDTEKISLGEGSIDPALAWARFESEEYIFMRGSIGSLKEGVGINQRYMFTRKLFEGNPDLMNQALHELDKAESFIDAITLLNERYVAELRWDINSEEVDELLQLVFRKFEDKQ